jgi:hypothetical protein
MISNTQDLIDSRDVINRIEELQDYNKPNLSLDESQELAILFRLDLNGAAYGDDWEYGCSVIRSTYFVEYIKSHYGEVYGIELENMPEIFRDAIDWMAVAESALIDYTPIDFDEECYYVRTKN